MYSKYNIVICRYKINTKFLLKHFNVYIMNFYRFSFLTPGFLYSCIVELVSVSGSRLVYTYRLYFSDGSSDKFEEKVFTLPFPIRGLYQAKLAAALILDNYSF